MAIVKLVMTLMSVFGKKKKDENKISLEEEKIQEAIKKEKRWRNELKKKDVSIETDNWHQTSHLVTDQDKMGKAGEKIMMIRREEDIKMGNVYEKVLRQLKNEKRRQRVMERKSELEEMEQVLCEKRKKFFIEREQAQIREREKAEERRQIYRDRELAAQRRDEERQQKREQRRTKERKGMKIKIQSSFVEEDMKIVHNIFISKLYC